MADEHSTPQRIVTDGWRRGESAIWMRKYRPGNGIPVNVVGVRDDRIRVMAPLRRGGIRLVWVRPETLHRHPTVKDSEQS